MEFDKNGKIIMPGSKKAKGKKKEVISEKIEHKDVVSVVDEKAESTYPIVEMKCEKCKHNKAYFWTLQTRASDESETKFYKCTNSKCGHTWRVYK